MKAITRAVLGITGTFLVGVVFSVCLHGQEALPKSVIINPTSPAHLPTRYWKRSSGFVMSCQICRSRISNATVAQPSVSVMHAAQTYAMSRARDMKVWIW